MYLLLVFYAFEVRFEETFFYYYWTFLITNVIFASYFLLNEIRQINNDGINYLKSFWNYIDIIPIVGIYAILTFSIIEVLIFKGDSTARINQTL